MKDDFADLEEPKSKGPLIVLLAFGLIGIIFASRLLTSSSLPIEGVVESIDKVTATELNASGAEQVNVRLTDGSIILARVAKGGALNVGNQVRVIEEPGPPTGPAYEAIAKASPH
jgi:hypothetical protein